MKLSFRRKKEIVKLPKVKEMSNLDQENSYVIVQIPSKGNNAGLEVKVKLSDIGKTEEVWKYLKTLDRHQAVLTKKCIEQDKELDALQKDVKALQALVKPVKVPKPVVIIKKKTIPKKTTAKKKTTKK
jgi:hypothetical protein